MPLSKFLGAFSLHASVFGNVKNRVQKDDVFNFDIASLNRNHILELSSCSLLSGSFREQYEFSQDQ